MQFLILLRHKATLENVSVRLFSMIHNAYCQDQIVEAMCVLYEDTTQLYIDLQLLLNMAKEVKSVLEITHENIKESDICIQQIQNELDLYTQSPNWYSFKHKVRCKWFRFKVYCCFDKSN